MNNSYEKLLQNLNVVKWELKDRNDPALNLCIKYIKDAIFESCRMNAQYEKEHQELLFTRKFIINNGLLEELAAEWSKENGSN